MDFRGYFKKGVELIKLSRPAADDLAQDPNAFSAGMLFVAIGGLAWAIGVTFHSFGMAAPIIIFWPIAAVLFSFFRVFILFIIARILGGTGSYKSYYGALGVGCIPTWAGIIPFLGTILSLWTIPIAVIVTERVHGLSTARSILVVILPFLFAFLALAFLVFIIGAAGLMNLFQMWHQNAPVSV